MPKLDPIEATWRRACVALLPPPRLTVSEWADRYRMLDNTSPEPGPWRTDRTPYLREIMDSLSPSAPCERVVFVKAAQVGGTEALLNFCGYLMAHAPAPILLVQPTVEMAKRFSKQRLDSLIESTPTLRGKVKDPRSRDSGNTVLMKEFAGGVLILTGANSAVGLRSLPAKYVLADELDAWPADADGEGDPFTLACKRTAAFGTQRKIFAVSTPTLEGLSRIEALWLQSDRRYYFVPCLRCGFYQRLVWDRLRWPEGRPDQARYHCEACEHPHENWQKTEMLARGEWRATAAGDGKTRGYHISALYAPVGWPGWPDLAREFLEARKTRETLQVFVNTVLGETWRDEAAVPLEADALYARREPFAAEAPAGVVLITAGADVQADRIECEVVGWGAGEESWSLGYFVLHGDTGQPEVWADLDRLLARQWRHESGLLLPVAAACIDAGFETATVIEFCSARRGRRIWAVKGASGFGKPIWPRRATTGGRHRGELFLIGADSAKERVYSRLRVERPGPGYCHFPLDRQRDWFEQLVSERIVVERGERKFSRPAGTRNEALDARAYATAALFSLYMAGFKLEEHARVFAAQSKGAAPPAAAYQVSRSSFIAGR
ncbi:MAG: phage terminase large subunit family protein [Bryobacterales bacterium]|nr:phage terminase large subunit family protein [Bryobacterales bacterium]